jgi:hypothetical protein
VIQDSRKDPFYKREFKMHEVESGLFADFEDPFFTKLFEEPEANTPPWELETEQTMREMQKTLETSKFKSLISTLILSKHNPFQETIQLVKRPEIIEDTPDNPSKPIRNNYGSSFRNIFSKPHNYLTGAPDVEHLLFINEKLIKFQS